MQGGNSWSTSAKDKDLNRLFPGGLFGQAEQLGNPWTVGVEGEPLESQFKGGILGWVMQFLDRLYKWEALGWVVERRIPRMGSATGKPLGRQCKGEALGEAVQRRNLWKGGCP